MAETNDETVVRHIVREFERFQAAYDRYMQRVDEAVYALGDALKDRAAPLVLDEGDVGIFFRDAGYLVDALRDAAGGSKCSGVDDRDPPTPSGY